MSQEEIDDLVAEGAIERVAPDHETARVELEQARLHAETAAEISDRDPVAAFAIGYDAVRKALSAHMRHPGYRVTRGAGPHARTGRYAIAAIDDPTLADHLDAFDELPASGRFQHCNKLQRTARCGDTPVRSPYAQLDRPDSPPACRGKSAIR